MRAEYDDRLEFQKVDGFRAPQWPGQEVPQQMHIDVVVDDLEEAEAAVPSSVRPNTSTSRARRSASSWTLPATRSASARSEAAARTCRSGCCRRAAYRGEKGSADPPPAHSAASLHRHGDSIFRAVEPDQIAREHALRRCVDAFGNAWASHVNRFAGLIP